jgi:pSer/pThr/pTyr-binding forkhead associated (FHA) protein
VLTLVGRSEGCRIRLTDPSVSKVHCSLLRTREGIWALDLLGRGGIEFNGRRVRWARMGPGDRLRVGRYAIEIRRLSEATGVDPSASGVFAVPPLPPRCPASASEAEPAGPVMARVVDQIGLMQREMSDRFQHAMLGMAEIFGDLQRDRMDLVDGELDRLRRLDRDLHVLQARIDPGARAAPPSTTSVPC